MRSFLNTIAEYISSRFNIAFFLLAVVYVVAFLTVPIPEIDNEHFVYLAEAFFRGRVDLVPIHGPVVYSDVSIFDNKVYLPFGPAPAIFFLPVVALFRATSWIWHSQPYLVYSVSCIVSIFVYKLGRSFKLSREQSAVFVLLFVLGTPFVQPFFYPLNSWTTHVFTTLFICAAVYEYMTKKRWWLISFLMGAAAASRLTAGIGMLFFVILFMSEYKIQATKLWRISWGVAWQLFRFCTPFLLCLSMLLAYNYVRFGDLFESGYAYQEISGVLVDYRNIGMFHASHILRNISVFLFGLPMPLIVKDGMWLFPYIVTNGWGISMLLMSPFLFWVLKLPYKDILPKAAAITSACIFIVLMFFFASGYHQAGYRYALDFIPYLFVILFYYIGKGVLRFSRPFTVAIVWSLLFGIYIGIFGTILWYFK